MVIAMVGLAALTAGSTMSRTYTVSSLNQRAKQYQGSMYAAEAAVEKVYARFRYDYLTGGHAAISNNLTMYRTNYPTTGENAHWANYEFSDAQGNINNTYVQLTSNRTYQVLDGNYAGLNGWRGIYRVISNARPLTGYQPVPAGVQQEIALDTIPAFQFAIFYNSQLEFSGCATLTVRGRTHANGPVCLGAASGNTLTFNGLVTSTSWIANSNLGGYTSFTTPVYNGAPSPGKKTEQPTLQLPIGTNNSAAAVREIIGLPAAGDSANLSEQRFFNKAGVVLLISNSTVTVNVKIPWADATTGIISNYTFSSFSNSSAYSSVFTASNIFYQRTNLATYVPFLNLTNRFQDYREGKWVMPIDINMAILKNWLVTNTAVTNKFPVGSGTYPTIMYVGDFRTVTNLHAVRVMNGSIIPTNGPTHAQAQGFTLATINPIYVWGHYNTPNTGHQGTENVSATFPAALVGDAITILSENWKDNTYGNGLALSSRTAANTTVNAAIIAGSVYTSLNGGVGNFSGGVVNLTRLLENWGSRTLTLNSSLVNLYNSVRAYNQFQNPGAYYNAPTRNFNFNTNYLVETKLPPGTPTVSVISRYKWTTTPINTVTYNGP